MKKDWLNHKLPDKLQDYASPLQEDQAWNRLATARQQQRRKKRRFFFIWLFIGAFFLSGVFGLFYLDGERKQMAAEQNLQNADKELKGTNDVYPNKSKKTINEENQVVEFSKTQNIDIEQIQSTPTSIETDIKSKNSITYQASSKEKKYALADQKNSTLSKTTKISQNISQKSESLISSSPAITEETKVSSVLGAEKKRETIEHLKREALNSDIQTKYILPVQMLPGIYPKLYKKKRQLANSSFDKLKSKPSFSKWVVGLQISYGKSWTQRSGNSQQEAYIIRRNNAEQDLDAWQANIFLQRKIGRSWFIESGINWQLSVSRFQDAFQKDTIITGMVDVAQVIEQQNGNRVNIAGVGQIRETTGQQSTIYNRHQLWSIPVLIGWHTTLIDKLDFEIAAGPVITLQQSSSGKTFADEQTLGDYRDLKELNYTSLGIRQATFRLGINYKLNPKWQIQSGLRSNWQWNSALKDDAGFEEKRQFLGGYLGLGFSL